MHVKGQIAVQLQLTPEARDFIARWLETTDFDDPIVGIGWGRWHDERVEHWLIGLYSRRRSSGWLCKAPRAWSSWLSISP